MYRPPNFASAVFFFASTVNSATVMLMSTRSDGESPLPGVITIPEPLPPAGSEDFDAGFDSDELPSVPGLSMQPNATIIESPNKAAATRIRM